MTTAASTHVPLQRLHAIIISQQQMYRAGNQVLLRTVEGYLLGGFTVTLVLPHSEDPQLAEPKDCFGDLGEHLTIIRTSPASRLVTLIKDLRWRRSVQRRTPDAAFADPRVTLPFHPKGRLLSAFTLASFTLAAVSNALRVWRTSPADVVVGFELMATPAAFLLSRRFQVPVVGHYQGTFLCEVLGKGKAAYVSRLVDYIGTALPLDLFFMLNDGTRGDRVMEELGLPAERVRFRLSGVRQDMHDPLCDRDHFLNSRELPIGPNSRLLVSLAKLAGWKRVERTILSMREVVAAEPSTHLLIAHRGPLSDALAALAKRIGVSENVHFIGPMNQIEVKTILNSCDIFLSVNDHSNLSNPLLEAMQAGCAIVTLDDGSTDGLLENGVSAVLVPREDLPQSLSKAVIELLRDDAWRRRLGAAARGVASVHLVSWPERVALEVNEVRSLIQRRVRGR